MPGERSDLPEALSESPGYLFATTARFLSNRTTKTLRPLGISLYEYVIMRLVSRNANISQGSLGEQYGIDPATMVDLIDRMEKREYIFRQRDSEDRRRYILRLTPKGNKVLAHAQRLVKKEQAKFLGALTDEEWLAMRGYLWRLVKANVE